MDRIPLNPSAIERLLKMLGVLGSAHDGERATAGLKAHELIRRHGLTWSDIIVADTPELHWRQKALVCFRNMSALNQCERIFVVDADLERYSNRKTDRLAHSHLREAAMTDAQTIRHQLRTFGFCPVPLYGKAPPAYGKNNQRKGLSSWQTLHEVSPAQIDMWSKTWPDAVNTGVLTAARGMSW
jgi:hypothetical protein